MESLFRTVKEKMVVIYKQIFSGTYIPLVIQNLVFSSSASRASHSPHPRLSSTELGLGAGKSLMQISGADFEKSQILNHSRYRSYVGLMTLLLCIVCSPCFGKIIYSNLQANGEQVFDFSNFPGIFFTPAFYPPSENVYFGKEVNRLIKGKGSLIYVHLDKEPSVYNAWEINVTFSPRLVAETPDLLITSFVLRSPVTSVINKSYATVDLWKSLFIIEKGDSFVEDMRTAMTQSLEAFLPVFLEQNKENKNLRFYMPDFVTQ